MGSARGLHRPYIVSFITLIWCFVGTSSLSVAAIDTHTKAITNPVGADLQLGLEYYRQDDFAKAVPYLEQAVGAEPATASSGIEARFLLGMSRFMMDDYTAAAQALEPIFQVERDNLDYLGVLGICYGRLRRSDDSARVFARLAKLGANTPQSHLLLGKAYLDLFEDSKSKMELEQAVAGNPKLPFAHYNLGVANLRLGLVDKAASEFDQEIALSPRLPWAYESRGSVFLDRGDFDSAAGMFSKALALNPKLTKSLSGLGRVYLHQGKTDAAIGCFERALELGPRDANLHYQLGRAYLKAGKQDKAQVEMAAAGRLQDEMRAMQAVDMEMSGASGMSGPPRGKGRLPAPAADTAIQR